MLNIAEFEHPHTPELIMHWIDVCTDPAAHRDTGGSTIATNPLTHRDQLVAVWIEQGQVSRERCLNRSRELVNSSMEEE
jgi:hypothetical protein